MKWCWTALILSPWRAFHLQGSQVLFHAAPQLPNGIFHTLNILHALSRSEHQRLVYPGSGVTMATAAERIWMFLGRDFAAGCVEQSGDALLTSVPLWASCSGRRWSAQPRSTVVQTSVSELLTSAPSSLRGEEEGVLPMLCHMWK